MACRSLACVSCMQPRDMVRVLPMKAFRPPSDLAEKISAPPYDVINSDEARKLADGNEISFLRVRRTRIGSYDHFYVTSLDLMFIRVILLLLLR